MAHLHDARAASSSDQVRTDPADALTDLLDHIAAELAEEYVRLMEAAAVEEETRAAGSGEESAQ
jgi:hypothetical protein